MCSRRVVIGLLLGLAIATGAKAQQTNDLSISTGNDLYEKCANPPDRTLYGRDLSNSGFCIGYIMGVASMLYQQGKVDLFAESATLDYRQLYDVVFNYLRDNPASRGRDPLVLTELALESAFPARKKIK